MSDGPVSVPTAPAAHVKPRGKLGQLIKKGAPPEEIEAARRDLDAAVFENHVRRLVDSAPPLTEVQRERLTALLLGARRDEATAA